ncbi:zinc finger BED domain-containing protein RICESLEEPER 2-like [Lathyrus oleraceus]|uniref:zinc finger BED domain-containing protein RICESLEEPER 2-like n=1 Tax=Pisum sativum TaxID=3888 RepID=UPI0021D009C1|nr:zinc finger BED domain-containing protein RICESLEEPER 2-like [Pisum sativum]
MEQGDSSREVPPVGLEIMEQEQQDTATEALIPPIDHSRKRRRPNADGPKKKSSCWDHFIELTDVVERTAACKHCHKRYRCDPKSHGTSNMLAHSKICYKNPYLENDLKQTNLAFGSGGLISVSPKFDKEACRKAITLFVILDEHPFRVVDGEGFIFLCNQLEPLLTIPSRRTVARDCFQLYLDEKLRLKAYFRSDCSRVALTTDCWTSIQNLSYITVTAHFVDNDWNYQKRIISFSLVPNHKGETIGRKLEDVLREWGLRNVSTITVDNASSNDVAVAYLKKRVHIKNGLMGEADFFHMRCCAHILNLIVNDGLKEQDSSVSSIRNAVRFVRSSPQRALKFKECVEFSRITCRKHLCLDVSTRWNSTYMMLDAAEKFQTAFEKLEGEDVGYVEWFGRHGPPCYTDWEKARAFVKFLKIFYEATKVFSSSQQVSLHTAYHQLSSVFGELQEASMNLNSDLASVGHEMKRKYDKY